MFGLTSDTDAFLKNDIDMRICFPKRNFQDYDFWEEEKQLIRLLNDKKLNKFLSNPFASSEYIGTALRLYADFIRQENNLTIPEARKTVTAMKERLEMLWKREIIDCNFVFGNNNEIDDIVIARRKELKNILQDNSIIKPSSTAVTMPYSKEILIPDRDNLVILESLNGKKMKDIDLVMIDKDKKKTEYFFWRKEPLELIVVEEINHALFRFSRGEWGEGFIKLYRQIPYSTIHLISEFNEVIIPLIQEQLFSGQQKYILPLIKNRSVLWQNHKRRMMYHGIKSIEDILPLNKLYLIDWIRILDMHNEKNIVGLFLHKNHPTYHERAQLLDEYKEFEKINSKADFTDNLLSRISSNKPATKNKIGRNEPCPCGSGKKYKKCCLRK